MTVEANDGAYRMAATEQGWQALDPSVAPIQVPDQGPSMADRVGGLVQRVRANAGRVTVAGLSVVGLGVTSIVEFGGSAPSAASAADTLTTVGGPTYDCPPDQLVVGAAEPTVTNGGTRLWSDAMESPLSDPSDAKGSFAQIEQVLCTDPVETVTLANAFANMTIAGTPLPEVSPWLKPFEFNASTTPNDIKVIADSYFPTKNYETVNNTQVQVSETTTPQSINDFRGLADEVISELQRFEGVGENTFKTSENYHLAADGVFSGGLPEVDLNPVQYDADAEWFTTTEKTGPNNCNFYVGFNVKDLRPETAVFCGPTPPEVIPPVTPPTSTTTTTSPEVTTTTKPHGTTTTQPKGTTTTTRPHGTTTTTRPTTTTTTRPHGTTTTTRPTTTTTTRPTTTTTKPIGPKQNPQPPVPGGETTTVPPAQPGGPEPTTSTTTTTTELVNGETTTTYTPPTTVTTVPPGSGTNLP